MNNLYLPYIKGERIYLRGVTESDVKEYYYHWLNDPEVNRYLETRFVPQSLDSIRSFVLSKDGNANEILLAICLLDSHEHIGNIKLGPINWTHRFADISLLIGDKRQWGKGIATEAISLITDFGFQQLNLHKLKAGCYEANEGSKNAFLKVGYELEGRLKQHFFSNGHYQDCYLLGRINPDYQP